MIETQEQFDIGYERLKELAQHCPTMKRVLLWGSVVTTKSEPANLDYSVIVEMGHVISNVAEEHRRFFVPNEARLFYGVDRNYGVIYDYPLGRYMERLDFICRDRSNQPRGIIEIALKGTSDD